MKLMQQPAPNLTLVVMSFEPLSTGLPADLLVSPALVQLTRGTVCIPIINAGVNDAVL